jgi:hypothetical protein
MVRFEVFFCLLCDSAYSLHPGAGVKEEVDKGQYSPQFVALSSKQKEKNQNKLNGAIDQRAM